MMHGKTQIKFPHIPLNVEEFSFGDYQHWSNLLAPPTASLVKNCALPSCYAVSRGNYLQTFRDNLSVTSRCVIAHKCAVLVYVAAEAWNRPSVFVLFGSCLTMYLAVVCLCSFRVVAEPLHRWRQNGSPLSALSGI